MRPDEREYIVRICFMKRTVPASWRVVSGGVIDQRNVFLVARLSVPILDRLPVLLPPVCFDLVLSILITSHCFRHASPVLVGLCII